MDRESRFQSQTRQAPHQGLGLSASQYSLWLDEHSLEDVVGLVARALDAAASNAAATDQPLEPAAAEVLAVMQALCRSAGGGK